VAEEPMKELNGSSLKESEKFEGSYWQWLKEELTGWDAFPWILFGIGTGFQLALYLTNDINWVTTVTFVGVFFGQWCTVAMGAGGWRVVNGKRIRVSSHAINGLLGSLSVIAYIIVNAQAHHWFSIIDQLCFFFLIDVELMVTWRTWGRGSDNVIKKLTPKGWVSVVIAILASWFVFYHVGLITGDNQPVVDALTLSIGATASWLCFRRYSTTYTLWLCSDAINILLWALALHDGYSQAALPMLVMQLFYLVTAIMGKMNWKPTKA